jgi:hypothetical protein
MSETDKQTTRSVTHTVALPGEVVYQPGEKDKWDEWKPGLGCLGLILTALMVGALAWALKFCLWSWGMLLGGK